MLQVLLRSNLFAATRGSSMRTCRSVLVLCLGIYAVQLLSGYDNYGLVCLAARAVTIDLQGTLMPFLHQDKYIEIAESSARNR